MNLMIVISIIRTCELRISVSRTDMPSYQEDIRISSDMNDRRNNIYK